MPAKRHKQSFLHFRHQSRREHQAEVSTLQLGTGFLDPFNMPEVHIKLQTRSGSVELHHAIETYEAVRELRDALDGWLKANKK